MKRYLDYMDRITAPEALCRRLAGLTAPVRPTAWKKYGAAAAALVLAVGMGIFGLSRLAPALTLEGETEPDIGVLEPAGPALTQSPTLGGYEVEEGEVVAYYMLPYLDYGTVETPAADYAIALPEGVEPRQMGEGELLELLGGEAALTQHLDWGGYALTGTALTWPDGRVWMLSVSGWAGPLDHFQLDVMEGELPPTCLFYEESVVNQLGDLEVTADRYVGEDSQSLRVSFLTGGYGYRFSLTAAESTPAEELVSRLVRYVQAGGLAVGEEAEEGAPASSLAPEAQPDRGETPAYDPAG